MWSSQVLTPLEIIFAELRQVLRASSVVVAHKRVVSADLPSSIVHLASAPSHPLTMQLSHTTSSQHVCHSTPRSTHSHHTAVACQPHKSPATSSSVCRAAQTKPEQEHHDIIVQKRSLLLGVAGFVAASWLQQFAPANAAASRAAAAAAPLWDLAAAADLVPAVLELERSPDQSKYDPAVSDLQPFLRGEHGGGGHYVHGAEDWHCRSLCLRWHTTTAEVFLGSSHNTAAANCSMRHGLCVWPCGVLHYCIAAFTTPVLPDRITLPS